MNRLRTPVLCILFLFGAGMLAAATDGELALIPASGTFDQASCFSVDVSVDTGGDDTVVVDAQCTFDPSVLEVVGVTPALADFPIQAIQRVDNQAGSLQLVYGVPTQNHVNSSAVTVCTVTFRAKAAAASTAVTFTFTGAGDSFDSNVVKDDGLGTDILGTVTNGSYTISAVDTSDADDDGLIAEIENTIGTSTGDADSDDDGFLDGLEYYAGTNPLQNTHYPGLYGLVLPYVQEDSAFRSNVGLFYSGDTEAATVVLTFVNTDGTLHSTGGDYLGRLVYQLAPNQYLPVQSLINHFPSLPATQGYIVANSREDVTIIGGPVDNVSNDPSVGGVTEDIDSSKSNQIFTPIVLKSGGWLTEIVIVNRTAQSNSLTFKAINSSGTVVDTFTTSLAARALVRYSDIIDSFPALTDGFYMLRVEGTGDIMGYCRQYNGHAGGIYPFYTNGQAALTVMFPYCADTDDYRTNIGVVAPTATANLTFHFYDYTDGTETTFSAQATGNAYTAFPNIIRAIMGQPGQTGKRGAITVSADQPIVAIGGPVNNISSDPSVENGKSATAAQAYTPLVLKAEPWSTEVAVFNPGDSTIFVNLVAFAPNGGFQPDKNYVIELESKRIFSSADVVTLLGGIGAGNYGCMYITANNDHVAFVHQYTPVGTGQSNTGGIYPVYYLE